MTIEVRRATADEVRPLRMRVLRPTSPVVPSAYDANPAAIHVAALDGEVIVGCATVYPEPYDDEPRAWRLRGMAVEPAYQGTGVGRQVLVASLDAVIEAGGPLLWATGRVSALAFYERLGWRTVGEVFTYGPQALPHLVIVHDLPERG
jgi:GNAT superfamily N-acetyltransferase